MVKLQKIKQRKNQLFLDSGWWIFSSITKPLQTNTFKCELKTESFVIFKNKKAALELSIGTIVILVLAMSMLILGLILIRTIFTGAKYNVETMNKK
ncbi:MAG: hypothetical protein AABX29_09845, partial [Nanoarchaeota archaeon]